MTPEEIYKNNLIKMGMQCSKCGKIYGIDHLENPYYIAVGEPIVDACEPIKRTGGYYYSFRWSHCVRNFNLFKVKGEWYKVRGALQDKFLSTVEIEEGIIGHIQYPEPINITRQVDIYTMATRLGVPPALNAQQQKLAKSRAFVELVKKR
jgi:hypothetical protein